VDIRSRIVLPIAALKHRDFRLFYTALVVAGMGSQVQNTANIWQIYQLTGSAFYLGLTGLVRALPILLLSLMGGVIADRVDRRRFIMVTQGLAGCFSLVLAWLTFTGEIQIWHIYSVTFLNSSLTALNAPARSAIIPNIVPKQNLLNAFALNSTVWQISNILGPAIGGVCIGLFGLSITYLVNGVAHLITLAALTAMHLSRVIAPSRKSTLKALAEGMSFLKKQSIIPILLSMDAAAMFFGAYRILMPIFADQLGAGAEGLGLMLSMSGVGAIVGAGVIMSLGDVRYKGRFVLAGVLSYCCCLVGLAVSPWFALALLMSASLGFSDSVQAIPRNTVIQAITPDEIRGRVSSFQSMLTNGVPSLGQMQVGAVASLVGAPLTLIVGAVLCATTVISVAFARSDVMSRDLGDSEEQPATTAVQPARAP
jgi:MFS family permease